MLLLRRSTGKLCPLLVLLVHSWRGRLVLENRSDDIRDQDSIGRHDSSDSSISGIVYAHRCMSRCTMWDA